MSDDDITAANLIDAIQEEFAAADEPVRLKDLARFYGVIAAQHEALVAMYGLVARASPREMFTDEGIEARRALEFAVHEITRALKDAADYPPAERRGDE